MKQLLIILILLVPSISSAHPVDQPISWSQWFAGVEGQPTNTHACTKNSTLFAKWREYWHHRRNFETETVYYGVCVGRHIERWAQGKAPYPYVDSFLLDYWQVIPAVPVINNCELYFACTDSGCRGWALNRIQEDVNSAIASEAWASSFRRACEAGL